MDISALLGEDLKTVAFTEDFLELRFGTPLLTLYAWPSVLLPEYSLSFGEPGYRDALCQAINEEVTEASLEEGDRLTVEFASGLVFALSLREEDLDTPDSGSFSATGAPADAEEF